MKLRDPDQVVNWYRNDEPGEYPTWKSACGSIEQRSWGGDPKFYGFFGDDLTAIPGEWTTSLASAKKAVEKKYLELVEQGLAAPPFKLDW